MDMLQLAITVWQSNTRKYYVRLFSQGKFHTMRVHVRFARMIICHNAETQEEFDESFARLESGKRVILFG